MFDMMPDNPLVPLSAHFPSDFRMQLDVKPERILRDPHLYISPLFRFLDYIDKLLPDPQQTRYHNQVLHPLLLFDQQKPLLNDPIFIEFELVPPV